MRELKQTFLSSLSERLLTAFASASIAAATLALTPFLFALAGGGLGGFIVVEAAPAWYGLVVSQLGIVIIGFAGVAGFFVSGDWMAEAFSFLWGTHSVWSRVSNRISDWSQNHGQNLVPLWVTVTVIAVLVMIAWVRTP